MSVVAMPHVCLFPREIMKIIGKFTYMKIHYGIIYDTKNSTSLQLHMDS